MALRCNIALDDRFIPSTILTATFTVCRYFRIPNHLDFPLLFLYIFFFCSFLAPSSVSLAVYNVRTVFGPMADYVLWVPFAIIPQSSLLLFFFPPSSPFVLGPSAFGYFMLLYPGLPPRTRVYRILVLVCICCGQKGIQKRPKLYSKSVNFLRHSTRT